MKKQGELGGTFGGSRVNLASASSTLAIAPIAKVSAVSAPLMTIAPAPNVSPVPAITSIPAPAPSYTPSTTNAVGSATPNAYQDVAKVAPYQAPVSAYQIPVMTMPDAGGLKPPPAPAPAPYAAPPPVPAPFVPAPFVPIPPSTSGGTNVRPLPVAPPPSSHDPGYYPPDASGYSPSAPSYSPAPASPASPSPSPPSPDPSLSVTVASSSPLAIPPAPPISVPGSASPTSATSSPLPSPSIWTRILRFFGFAKAPPAPPVTVAAHGEPLGMTQERVAVSLVRRARSGDQNAMATLDMIGKNARAGDVRAKRSYDLCLAYAKAHPEGSDIGGEGAAWDDVEDEILSLPQGSKSDPLFAQAIAISHGPLLTRDAIMGYAASSFGGEEEVYAFSEGMRTAAPLPYGDSRTGHASFLGAVMGIARRIQQARDSVEGLALYDARMRAEVC